MSCWWSHRFRFKNGGVTGRPQTMCPRTNVLGLLVHVLIVPGDTMSLHWCIHVIMHYALHMVDAKWQGCINAGTWCFRDNSSRGPGVPEQSYVDTSFGDVPKLQLKNGLCIDPVNLTIIQTLPGLADGSAIYISVKVDTFLFVIWVRTIGWVHLPYTCR